MEFNMFKPAQKVENDLGVNPDIIIYFKNTLKNKLFVCNADDIKDELKYKRTIFSAYPRDNDQTKPAEVQIQELNTKTRNNELFASEGFLDTFGKGEFSLYRTFHFIYPNDINLLPDCLKKKGYGYIVVKRKAEEDIIDIMRGGDRDMAIKIKETISLAGATMLEMTKHMIEDLKDFATKKEIEHQPK